MTFKHLEIPSHWEHYWTKYPEGYTILEALFNWVNQVNSMVDNQNLLNGNVANFRDELEQFIDTFDENLQETVINVLQEWQESGFLNIIINEALQTQIDEVEDKLNNLGLVNVKDFGAKGDGVTDDTEAFRAANLFGYNKTRIDTSQFVSSHSMQILIPSGVYHVKGSNIFGSPLAEGEQADESKLPAIIFKVVGDNATIIWDIEREEDTLFYFDGTIQRPQIKGLNIFVTSQKEAISNGGNVFKYYQDTKNLGYANASKGHYEDIYVCSGRATSNTNFSTKPKRVFYNVGDAMSDQTVVKNCSFEYFNTFYRGENPESVNWTFENCSFFGGGFGESIVFDIESMTDNFNVVNCSFSMYSNETLLKTSSPIDNGLYTQTPFYNFNFDSNRIELYGEANETWYLADMNFGRLNMKNSNLRLAQGAGNVKTIVSGYGLANFNFENVAFNGVEFLLPIANSPAITGGLSSIGAYFKHCDFIRSKHTFKFYDGTTVYEIKDAIINKDVLNRPVIIEQCTYLNGNGTVNFEIASTLSLGQRDIKSVTYSENGVAVNKTFTLPPYQTIKSIVLSGLSTLPESYNKIRIYFGEPSIGNYIDVENPQSNNIEKNSYTLWEGDATVFYSDLTKQSITVKLLNSGTETEGGNRSKITVTYEAIDPASHNITSSSDTISVRTKGNANYGSSSKRPTLNLYVGQCYYDTSLFKPIYWSGTDWLDSNGTNVNV